MALLDGKNDGGERNALTPSFCGHGRGDGFSQLFGRLIGEGAIIPSAEAKSSISPVTYQIGLKFLF